MISTIRLVSTIELLVCQRLTPVVTISYRGGEDDVKEGRWSVLVSGNVHGCLTIFSEKTSRSR